MSLISMPKTTKSTPDRLGASWFILEVKEAKKVNIQKMTRASVAKNWAYYAQAAVHIGKECVY